MNSIPVSLWRGKEKLLSQTHKSQAKSPTRPTEGLPRVRSFDVAKRFFDILFSSLLLILTSPLQIILAFLVRLNLGSPIIFHQPRPGLRGEIFTLHKFRSMKNVDELSGCVEDADRLTPFGRILRATSLDELPTLWNVLRGDMSLVGPRPLLVEYLDFYTPEQSRRHEVRPGVTGLAQVNGRNAISWEDKFALDVLYVDTRSFLLDVKILMRTIIAVATRKGISHPNHATTPKFGISHER